MPIAIVPRPTTLTIDGRGIQAEGSVASEAAARERFFALMAHELRTPAATLLAYCTLLSDGTAGELPTKAAEMIVRMTHSVRHLRELVDDILDLARLDAGKMRLTIDEVALSSLVSDTLASVEPLADAKGLALEFRATDIPNVWTDAQRVEQIVLNLASNAIKFTEHGRITVTLERHASSAVAVRVADTGIGIASGDLERVFDEFVQVGPTHGGTGLGLTISRRLARLLGGDITVSSSGTRGSCFTLTLPTAPVADSRGPDSPARKCRRAAQQSEDGA